MSNKPLRLDEIAKRIDRHLQRFADNPTIATKTWVDGQGVTRELTCYWQPIAARGGARVMVKYVSYQYASSLTRAQATAYLAWLDAGNVGTHYYVPEDGR